MDAQGVADWRKASYSGNGGGSCVEVGRTASEVAIRDTKNRGTGPVLTVSAGAWESFTAVLKRR